MRLVDISEIEQIGGTFVSSGCLNLGNISYVRGGSFPESSENFAFSMCRTYNNQGINCLLIRSSGMITIWREDKETNVEHSQTSINNTLVTSFQPDTDASSPTKKALIVYIDDSSVEAKIMERIVREMHLDYYHVHNSVQAVAIMLKVKPTLIFLDLNMPIVNGYEICAQLRRVTAFKDIPIIMVTSSDGIVDRVRAKVAGATDFLSKPINRDKIGQCLAKYHLI